MSKVQAPKFWSEAVSLRPRFHRSAHLERDFHGAEWLRGYIVTPLARSLLSRVAAGLAPGRTSRAWSFTGPYGTGKSAFGLFLSHALGAPQDSSREVARRLLKECDPTLHCQLFARGGLLSSEFGLHPVLATGQAKRIESVLLDALEASLQAYWQGGGSKPEILDQVQAAAKKIREDAFVNPKEVVELFELAAQKVAASKRGGSGLLIILDEAGRVLEQAARGISHGDVHLLQELAEAASRSGDTPIVLVVMLHQAFDQYATRLSTAKRNEWAKIQGRFEDVPFQESADQVVRLIGASLKREKLPGACADRVRKQAARVADLVNSDAAETYAELLADAAPLHPTTALALGPLFRSRLAQNERSLFAFLGSSEPQGFRQFLDAVQVSDDPTFYRLDQLYDYVVSAFGGRIYTQQGHAWALVESAIRRLPKSAVRLDERVLKVVGLLGMFGELMGLKASEPVVVAALTDAEVSPEDVRASLARVQAASLLVFRKYQGAYLLWEGSDLNIEDLVQKAHGQVNPDENLPKRLARVVPPRPVVARKHLFETGTFRYFEVRYADETLFSGQTEDTKSRADGLIWLLIPAREMADKQLHHDPENVMSYWALESSTRPIVIGLPEDAARIRSLATDLLAMEYVRAHTSELQSDPVARRELVGRITEVERLLRSELSVIFTNEGRCRWINGGGDRSQGGTKPLTRVLSDLCDQFYKAAPHIHNELINRSALSSASAAAQRELMQAMVQRGDQFRLGIEGNPPEMSMYRSILEDGGIHAQTDGRWTFVRPKSKRKRGSAAAAWDAILAALDNDGTRVVVSDIYVRLGNPPLGVKAGIQPVLLLAVMLANKDDIATYEDGVFVPEITDAFIERLLRAPSKFELQLLRLSGERAQVFDELKGLLTQPAGSRTTLVTISRALATFAAQLPAYTKHTRRIDDRTRAVREALLRGKEPAALLFSELPSALGLGAISAKSGANKAQAEVFVQELRSALRDLKQAYHRMLDEFRSMMAEALGLPSEVAELRQQGQRRAARALDLAGEMTLKAFLMRMADPKLGDQDWLVSMGTLIVGKPPVSWNDQDVERARTQLVRISQSLSAVEAMVLARREAQAGDVPLVRVAVASSSGAEVDHVVALAERDADQVGELKDAILALLQKYGGVNRNGAIAAAALACRALIEGLPSAPERTTTEASR